MSGSTGNLPPGVVAANFVASPPSQDAEWYIDYSVSTTETMPLTITAVQTPPPPQPPPGGVPGLTPTAPITVPANQNVNGWISMVPEGVYNMYIQPNGGPNVLVWTDLAVPAASAGGGEQGGLGFGYGQGFPPGHKIFQPTHLPVGEPTFAEPGKPNA
jgi:hypothetical protein